MQPVEGKSDTYFVYYHILDGDQNGCAPNSPNFDSSKKSCIHKIAKTNNKVITKNILMNHSAASLIFRKWCIMMLFDCC